MHSSKFVSWGFLLLAINMPLQFTDEKSNDSSMREWMPLDALNWFGRGNELHTPKSFQFVLEVSKSWALSMVPHFSLSPPRFAFLAWGDYTCSRFARSTIPEEIWGPLSCSLCFLSFTETNRWTCLNSICTLSSGSQMLKHVPNFRPFYLFYLFFFLESRIPKSTEWCQRDLSLKFHIMAS